MVHLKSEKELKIMQEGGRRLRRVVAELLPLISAGTTTKEIDDKAEQLIKKQGGEASFKKVRNYFWTTCLPINEQIVHTPPSDRVIKTGDMLTVDIGMYYQGFHTDFATTFVVKGDGKVQPNKKIERLLKVGKETLGKALKKVKNGAYLGEISQTIEKEIYGNGFFVSKQLTGHGIGRKLHEDPYVPGFLDRPVEKTYRMRPGLAIAVEIIYSEGTEDIQFEKGSDWSIVTADGSMSACFEHTIALFNKNALVLT